MRWGEMKCDDNQPIDSCAALDETPGTQRLLLNILCKVTVWLGSLLSAHHGRGIVPGSVEGRSQAEHLLILGPPDYPALIKSE